MQRLKKLLRFSIIPFTIIFVWWLCCLPNPLFKAPLSTQLLSVEGELLSARIAADGQWRMPAADSVSPKLIAAVLNYEDRTFYRHWGVSLRGIGRALRDNWRAGRVVSGGSTITMQVARMARGNRARTLVQKLIEAAMATRLEWRYDKPALLRLWLANAPFGGNVVGAEAAARRYYGRAPADLSWGEAAVLAVLPNSPALIHPGRSRQTLREKRDALLDDLAEAGTLSAEAASLAKLESLPGAPRPLPRLAEHLLERLRQARGPGRYRTSLPVALQTAVTELANRHQRRLAESEIYNLAVQVTEVATGRVVAYVGNASPAPSPANAPVPIPRGTPLHSTSAPENRGYDVDVITAPRSPGSLLKPILYGLALEDGLLSPQQLLRDVPINIGGYQPANFYRSYDGAVAADEALARSLNIPFVDLLQRYRTPRFHAELRDYGFAQLRRPADHYGLSLILGGGEVTMAEINAWFLGMARQLRYYYPRMGRYQKRDFAPATLLAGTDRPPLDNLSSQPGPIGAGAGYLTLEALTELSRPDETGATQRFSSHRPVAWKTGTSFGFRDAWAVGCTPAYVVSVWAGNADGEGRQGLVGVKAAAPLFFRVLRLLDRQDSNAPRWFEPPYDELRRAEVCTQSGYPAGIDCPVDSAWVVRTNSSQPVCPHHKRLFTDPRGEWRVQQGCGPGPIQPRPWFTLPAKQAYYYRRRHPTYSSPPSWHPDCHMTSPPTNPMAFIYPFRNGTLSPSKNWRGETEPFPLELAHQRPAATVHWHLNGNYLNSTTDFHSLSIHLDPGDHLISVVDDGGQRLERYVQVK